MLSLLLRRFGFTRPPARTPRRDRPRLGLEALEGREVPATLFALAPGNTLLRFDSATPAAVTTTAITGITAGQTARGLDFRPRTGQLLLSTVATGSANSSVVSTYSVNPLTGAATLLGSTAAALPGAGDVPNGYDFNPTVDRIRYVNTNDENARLNPNNGALAGDDTDLTLALTSDVIGQAYDRNFDRQNNAGDSGTLGTTLFGINRLTSTLVRQGGPDGTPSPNGGLVTDVGPLGVALDATDDGGFDILASSDNGGLGTAFAALSTAGGVSLFNVNLTTGAATLVGTIGTGGTEVYGLAAAPTSALLVGSGLGANADVRTLDPATGGVLKTFVGAEAGSVGPFVGFQGGVRVASGDVNRDGTPDAIVSAVAPQGHVKVFDGISGVQLTGNPLGSVFAFAGFNGTVNVGSADVNRDGFDDVLVVANGSNGHVKAFSGADGSLLASFLAYDGFLGNVTVAGADFNNDGTAEIVTTAAINGHLKVFNVDGSAFSSASLPGFQSSFFAFSPYLGDVSVAVGDLSGDGTPDFVLGSGPGVPLNVRIVNGADGTNLSNFIVSGFGSGYTGGGNVGVSDVNADGRYEAIVTPNSGTAAAVLAFDALGGSVGSSFPAFASFLGGVTVAGKRF